MQLLFCILFALASCSATKPTNVCVNCQHFTNLYTDVQFGKCTLFPNESIETYELVRGFQPKQHTEYYHCAVARTFEDLCGKEGKMFKKKRANKIMRLFDRNREQEQ